MFGQASEDVRRIAIAEGAIDALSLASLEGSRADTLYVATGGGMGPGCVFRGKSARHSDVMSAADSDVMSAIPI